MQIHTGDRLRLSNGEIVTAEEHADTHAGEHLVRTLKGDLEYVGPDMVVVAECHFDVDLFDALSQKEKFTLHDVLINSCTASVQLSNYNMLHSLDDTANSAIWWEHFNLCRELVP
jgi:hypothetical protein